MTETSFLLFGWVNVGRVVGNSRNYFCNILKISESMKPFARHYVGTLTKLVPGRYYERVCFPAGFLGEIVIFDILKYLPVFFKACHGLSYARPAYIVKSNGNCRNDVKFSVVLIFLESVYCVLGINTVLLPVVSVRGCSAHCCHCLKRSGVSAVAVGEEYHNAVKAVLLDVLVHEFNSLNTAGICSAERLLEVVVIPYGKYYFVVNSVKSVIKEIVVNPVAPNVFLELLKT